MGEAPKAAAAAAIESTATSSETSPVSSTLESGTQANLATSLSKGGPSKRTSTAAHAHAHHAHRQNHNSSKLPAFRFADLQRKQQSSALPSLQHQQKEYQQQQQQQQQGQHEDEFPPSPVSPDAAPIDAPRVTGSGRDSGSGSSTGTGCYSDHALSPQHASRNNSGAAKGAVAAAQTPSGPAWDSNNAQSGTRRTSASSGGSERDTSENLNGCIDAPPRTRNRDSPPRAPVKPASPRSTAHQARTSHQQHQQPNHQPRQQQQQQQRRHRQDSQDSLHQIGICKTNEISESHPPSSTIADRGPSPSDPSASKPSSTSRTTAIASRPPSFPEDSSRVGLSRASASFEATKSATTPTEVAGSTGNAGPRHGQSTSSFSSNDVETAPGPTTIAETKRLRTTDSATAHEAPPSSTENESATKEWARSQRELILPKSLQGPNSLDDKRPTGRSRPPVSFRKPSAPSVSSGSVRVAPIRSFRSSGSRRSSGFDMNSPIHAGDSSGDDYPHTDSNQRARTLRALEGRSDDEMAHASPSIRSARNAHLDGDDTTGDVFMKIARQEAPGRAGADKAAAVEGSAVSRVSRASHRRPLSTSITPSYRPNSPPRLRRLSDQSDNAGPRSRQVTDHGAPFNTVGEVPARGLVREKAASSHPGENFSRPGSGYRTSPVTPRFYNFRDASTENSPSSRRRTSITESTGGFSVRNSAYKPSHLSNGHSRTYNSSPLVPRSAEPHPHEGLHEGHRGLEGTESTASTTAPSTVWDELDDLKSRIHRLELTGKLPSTSSAAINKVLDDRPTTATNTTVSTSPKQAPKKAQKETPVDEEDSGLPLMRDPQPVLLSAVDHSKPLLSEEVSRALENAASDATALIAMMGSAGQPGPISSGASTIGAGGTLTDRQLRRRAEGICRSLTELVLALSEEAGHPQAKTITTPATDSPQHVAPLTPTLTNKTFPSLPAHRRGSVVQDDPVERPESIPSPRAMSKLEERRNAMLKSSTLPSPRPANGLLPAVQSPAPTPAGTGRRSSLLISRTRRAATEEPEDGRRSSMLRTRRVGTEEPEEGRKASLMRDYRGTNNDEMEDDGPQFRAPSRAITDVNGGARAASHHFQSSPAFQDPTALGSSALPRRRIGSSILGSSRLASAASSSGAGGSRRYLERSTPDRDGNSFADKLAEDRGQRQMSTTGQHSSLLNRTASLLRRPNRDNNSSASSQVGSLKY